MAAQKAPSSTGGDYRDEENDPLDDLRTTSVFAALSTLYMSETYSDMKIVCGRETFHAHRAVVCPQSPFFDRALSGGFQETTSRVIELPVDDPQILRLFLQFLYTGNYQDGFTPCSNRPAIEALMAPEEVSEQLNNAPGVAVGQSSSEAAEEMNGDGVRVPDTGDGVSDVGNESEYEGTVDEPEEEYNQFGGDDDLVPPTKSPVSDTLGQDDNVGDTIPADLQDYFSKSRHLLTHTRVYIMAHIYDVPSLRLLARERFYRAAERGYLTDDAFMEAVDEIYSKTPETDVAMREIMCRLTANGIKWVEGFNGRIEPIMRKHGDFAVGVLNYVLKSDSHW